MMIMLLTLFVEEYTYGTSIEEYKHGTLYNSARYSLSNHVNDRQYFQQQQPQTQKTSSSTVLLYVLVHVILTLNQHLIALLPIPQSINKLSFFIHGSSSPSPEATWFGLTVVLALHLGANARIWLETNKFLGQVRTLDGLKSSTTLSWKPSSSCPCQVLQACNAF